MDIDFESFANEIIDASEDGDIGIDKVQAVAEKYGLLKIVTADKPCGEGCVCRDMFGEEEFPTQCYRKTYI